MWRRLRMLENKDYAPQCAEMIEKQLRRRGISDEAVLAAMTAVPRHEFVPGELRSRAYEDVPLPIGGGLNNIVKTHDSTPVTGETSKMISSSRKKTKVIRGLARWPLSTS